MTDITALRARQDELMRQEYERQLEQNAPAREIERIEQQIAAAEQQNIVEQYNVLATQYGEACTVAMSHLSAMVNRLGEGKLSLARAAGREAISAVEQTITL